MTSFVGGRRIFVSTRPVDFRNGVHGLVALVAESLKHDPYCGDAFVFRAKRNDRQKLLLFDGSGMLLATKWLVQGGFAWPAIKEGAVALTPTQFAMLFNGVSERMRITPPAVKSLRKTA